jgi:hypothetical protein
MMAGYSQGTKVKWVWGSGSATGTISSVYTQKRTLKIDGNDVTREASESCPSYEIEQEDGQRVFKSHSEFEKA